MKCVVIYVCYVSPEAAGGLVEPVSDGVSAHGMCVFVTSQRESQLEHLRSRFYGKSSKNISLSITAAAF